jgi:hypothetical protein
MPGSQDVQQFEFRWQPSKDLSVIASSMPESVMQRWSDRIMLWVRHPAQVPAASVRYEDFGDGAAAFVWRHRLGDQDQAPTEGRPVPAPAGGRPEVSRLLIGSAEVLTPKVAVALCCSGLPVQAGPPAGLAERGSRLPRLDPVLLTSLPGDLAGDLDAAAAGHRGLDQVIATALDDLNAPLAVQLPVRLISAAPSGGSQAALLWGLLRTVDPLLGADRGQRGWSFSTFEPPLGNRTTSALADIVFRIDQAAEQGMSTRYELAVRPMRPDGSTAPEAVQEFGRLLVVAYQRLGGDALGEHIEAVGGDYASLRDRCEGIAKTLRSVLAVQSATRETQETVSASQYPDGGEHAPSVQYAPSVEYAPSGAPDWLAIPGSPATSVPPVAAVPTPAGPVPVPAGQVPVSAGQVPAPPGQARQVPVRLCAALDQLTAGPASPQFQQALQVIHTGAFPDWPADRAQARRILPDRDWYLPVLLEHDNAGFEGTLAAILAVAVLPDIGDPAVVEEVSRWSYERAAPAVVLRALQVAARNSPGGQELPWQAIEQRLGRRWLTEHGIYPAAAPYVAPASGQAIASHAAPGARRGGVAGRSGPEPLPDAQRPHGMLFNGKVRVDLSTTLLLFCLILTAMLVLSLLYR